METAQSQPREENALSIEGSITAIAGDDPVRADVLRYMETRDTWVVDPPSSLVDRTLLELGELIQGGHFRVPEELGLGALIELLAMLRSGRSYRLIQEIHRTRPEFLDQVIAQIQQVEEGDRELTPEMNVVRNRLVISNQLSFLLDLFSPERIELMTLAVEDAYADEY